MIVDALLYLIRWFISLINQAIGAILPVATLPDGFNTAIQQIRGYVSAFDMFLSISSLLSILGLIFTFEGIVLGYKIFNYFRKMIPTQS